MFLNKKAKVLHVGNIAHNAYYNSRSLSKLGYKSDILVHDFYHYAACPEWLGLAESGVSKGCLGSDLFPNFFQFSNTKKLRPKSFVQGPMHLSLAYLWLKQSANSKQAKVTWSILQYQRLKIVAEKNALAWQTTWSSVQFKSSLSNLNVHDSFVKQLKLGFSYEQKGQQFLELLSNITETKLASTSFPFTSEYLDSVQLFLEQNNHLEKAQKLAKFRKNSHSVALGVESIPSLFTPGISKVDIQARDLTPYAGSLPSWHEVLKQYKYRIMYSTHPIFAYLSNTVDYAAYEHGTIRTIPFESSSLGQLTKVSYQNAKAVLITNADYVLAKKKLLLDPSKIAFIPHGFDQAESNLFLRKNSNLRPQNDVVVFIAPARHTWQNAEDGNSKGNDQILLAMKSLLSQGINNFRVYFIEYGEDVCKTKELVKVLGLENQTRWLSSQTRSELWRRYLTAHAVLDQFIIPAIGAIGVESLALGRRLINADNGSLKIFFGVQPPILGTTSVNEIALRMRQVIDDPEDTNEVGKQAKKWFLKYHSEQHIRSQLKNVIQILDDG